MRPVPLSCALVAAAVLRLHTPTPDVMPPQTQVAGGVDAIVDRAAAYVLEYQQQLTAVVADEIYTQHVRHQIPRDRGMPQSRVMKSEIFFLFTPGQVWVAMRDVMTVDGRAVTDRPDLMEALRRLPAPEVARTFKDYNSRFNLGQVKRNFNEPTLSLLVLDKDHRGRFKFDLRRMERSRDETLAVVAFREVAEPTLIRNLDGGPVYSTGEMVIEPSTGRVRRAMLSLKIGSVRMTLTTTYEADARLDMLVPVRFGESYQDGVLPNDARRALLDPAVFYEEIVCEAKYTNFRRFEVKARIR